MCSKPAHIATLCSCVRVVQGRDHAFNVSKQVYVDVE